MARHAEALPLSFRAAQPRARRIPLDSTEAPIPDYGEGRMLNPESHNVPKTLRGPCPSPAAKLQKGQPVRRQVPNKATVKRT